MYTLKKIKYLFGALVFFAFLGCSQGVNSGRQDRLYWVQTLDKIANPVLTSMSQNELKANMPIEKHEKSKMESRQAVTHLEALGRLLCGVAPWLELGPDATPEGKLRAKYIDLSVQSISNAVNPDAADYLNFNQGRQPLVDAAFLAQALLRAPKQLWGNLDSLTKQRLISELKSSRVIQPSQTNWLFFAAMVEAALLEFSDSCQMATVDYAFEKFKEWYKGDAWYGDGPDFHLDYYNSFVIQPMMVDILDVLQKHDMKGADFYEVELPRLTRYAEQQERLISPEGAYPVVGRSIAYRFGCFHALGVAALMKVLPESINPAQVRCALTAVIKRQISAPETFDKNGWLQIGFCGHQPSVGETYISTGSLYLCSFVFAPLGLSPDDDFWIAPAADWTGKKAWSGQPVNVDKALKK